MRQEAITEEGLLGELRLQGVEDQSEVREARVEQDGRISVIKKDAGSGASSGEKQERRAA